MVTEEQKQMLRAMSLEDVFWRIVATNVDHIREEGNHTAPHVAALVGAITLFHEWADANGKDFREEFHRFCVEYGVEASDVH